MKKIIVWVLVLTMTVLAGVSAACAENSGVTYDVILKDTNNKLSTISAIREILGLSLAEGKDFVETAPRTVGRNLNADTANAIKNKLEAAGAVVRLVKNGGDTAAANPVKDEKKYKVVLYDCGNDKAGAVKIIRQVKGCDLITAKHLTELLPAMIADGLTANEADQIVNRFRNIGADAETR